MFTLMQYTTQAGLKGLLMDHTVWKLMENKGWLEETVLCRKMKGHIIQQKRPIKVK